MCMYIFSWTLTNNLFFPFLNVVDVVSKLGLCKSSVVQHMSFVVQPILEKAIVVHSIIHSLLMEYLSIAHKVSEIISLFLFPIFAFKF